MRRVGHPPHAPAGGDELPASLVAVVVGQPAEVERYVPPRVLSQFRRRTLLTIGNSTGDGWPVVEESDYFFSELAGAFGAHGVAATIHSYGRPSPPRLSHQLRKNLDVPAELFLLRYDAV